MRPRISSIVLGKACARVSIKMEGRLREALCGAAERQYGITTNSSVRAPTMQQHKKATVALELILC